MRRFAFVFFFVLMIQVPSLAASLNCSKTGLDVGAIVSMASYSCFDKLTGKRYNVELSGIGAVLGAAGTMAKISCSGADIAGTYYGARFGFGVFPVPTFGSGGYSGSQGSCSFLSGGIGYIVNLSIGTLTITDIQ